MNRLPRLLLALGLAGMVVLTFGGPAAAHANLASSNPAADALLDQAPNEVTLTFSEPPDPALSSAHVLDVNGGNVEAGPAEVVPGTDALRVPLPAGLPDGVYTVSWRVVSVADGHATAGAFSFGVNVGPGDVVSPSVPIPSSPPPSAASVAGKVSLYVGLALAFASAVVGALAFGGVVPARRVVLSAAAAATVVGAVVMLFAERATLEVSMGDLLSSSTGIDYIWLLGGAAFAGIASLDAARRSDRRSLVVVGVAAAATMLIRAGGGHAAAAATPVLDVGLQWFHFMAAGVWIGGLALALLLVRSHHATEDPPPIAEIRRYSTYAGVALAVVLLTGIVRATHQLGGVSELFRLFDGSYDTVLDVKVTVVIALIALGAFNRYRSIPRIDTRPRLLTKVMTIELIGALGVFGLTGTLTSLAPRTPATPPPPPPSVTAVGSDFATTMKVRLVATPGTAGPNEFNVFVVDYDSGAPLDVSEVSLHFEPVGRSDVGTSTLELMRHGDRWMATGTQLSIAGVWDVTVLIQTAASGSEIPLTLVTRIPDQQVTVATAEGQPDIYSVVFPGGEQVQMYNDPGTPGTDEFHLTAFGADGTELPIRPPTMVAVAPDGTASALPPRRFSPGHFVGDLTLVEGRWTFFVQASTRDGRVLVASFEQAI